MRIFQSFQIFSSVRMTVPAMVRPAIGGTQEVEPSAGRCQGPWLGVGSAGLRGVLCSEEKTAVTPEEMPRRRSS